MIKGTPAAITALTWDFSSERVTGIEPARSAWEYNRFGPLTGLTWTADAPRATVIDPVTPGVDGPPMARRRDCRSSPTPLVPGAGQHLTDLAGDLGTNRLHLAPEALGLGAQPVVVPAQPVII